MQYLPPTLHLRRLTLLPDLCMWQNSLGRRDLANSGRVTGYDYLQAWDFFKSTGPDRAWSPEGAESVSQSDSNIVIIIYEKSWWSGYWLKKKSSMLCLFLRKARRRTQRTISPEALEILNTFPNTQNKKVIRRSQHWIIKSKAYLANL